MPFDEFPAADQMEAMVSYMADVAEGTPFYMLARMLYRLAPFASSLERILTHLVHLAKSMADTTDSWTTHLATYFKGNAEACTEFQTHQRVPLPAWPHQLFRENLATGVGGSETSPDFKVTLNALSLLIHTPDTAEDAMAAATNQWMETLRPTVNLFRRTAENAGIATFPAGSYVSSGLFSGSHLSLFQYGFVHIWQLILSFCTSFDAHHVSGFRGRSRPAWSTGRRGWLVQATDERTFYNKRWKDHSYIVDVKCPPFLCPTGDRAQERLCNAAYGPCWETRHWRTDWGDDVAEYEVTTALQYCDDVQSGICILGLAAEQRFVNIKTDSAYKQRYKCLTARESRVRYFEDATDCEKKSKEARCVPFGEKHPKIASILYGVDECGFMPSTLNEIKDAGEGIAGGGPRSDDDYAQYNMCTETREERREWGSVETEPYVVRKVRCASTHTLIADATGRVPSQIHVKIAGGTSDTAYISKQPFDFADFLLQIVDEDGIKNAAASSRDLWRAVMDRLVTALTNIVYHERFSSPLLSATWMRTAFADKDRSEAQLWHTSRRSKMITGADAFFLGATACSTQTLHVPCGSDSDECGRNLALAYRALASVPRPNAELVLADGTYTASAECRALESGCTALLEIAISVTIRALNPGKAVLDAQSSGQAVRRGIRITGGTVTLHGLVVVNGGTVHDSSVSGFHGGVYIDPTRPIRPAELVGAGLYVSGSGTDVAVEHCTITWNHAQRGGGVFINDGVVRLVSSIIRDNHAAKEGGGILYSTSNDGGILELSLCEISRNSAGVGGGMHYEGRGKAVVEDCTFTGNIARLGGGGLNSVGAHATVYKTAFNHNLEDNVAGGGISFSGAENHLEVSDSTFDGNSAKRGGGVATTGNVGSLSVESSVFVNNVAKLNGGGVYLGERKSCSFHHGSPYYFCAVRLGNSRFGHNSVEPRSGADTMGLVEPDLFIVKGAKSDRPQVSTLCLTRQDDSGNLLQGNFVGTLDDTTRERLADIPNEHCSTHFYDNGNHTT